MGVAPEPGMAATEPATAWLPGLAGRSRRATDGIDGESGIIIATGDRVHQGSGISLVNGCCPLSHLIQVVDRRDNLAHHVWKKADEDIEKEYSLLLSGLKTSHMLEHLFQCPVAQ